MNMAKTGARILIAIMILAGSLLTGRAGGQAVPASGTTERVSVASDGTQGDGDSYDSFISADGRYVAFASFATNLVGDDTNGIKDIFVYDRVSGETSRVSIASDGSQGNDTSYAPQISADGGYVVFDSYADNLVGGDTNGAQDVFVHDRATGETSRVSVASDGTQGNASSWKASISADGRDVTFQSSAYNLVSGDSNGFQDVFVHNRESGETSLVSVASDGAQGNGHSYDPGISADGRYVAFYSTADNLVAGDTNGTEDVFVHDLETGETRRVSVTSNGTQANGASWLPAISADGRYVAFDSYADNLVDGDTNSSHDIFVHDRVTGETSRVSVSGAGTQGNGHSYNPGISADGSFVVFHSDADNLVDGDTNGYGDVFVHDQVTGETRRVSVSSDGTQGNYASLLSSISADGRYVAFHSEANNLVGSDTNFSTDVFVHDRGGEMVEKRPVVLVPGMLASWNPGCILFGSGCEDESAWEFFPIIAREVYQPLIDQLASAGYTEDNHYLKIVYYNWTQPIDSNLQRLMDKIDEVKTLTGATQVDLIGHSMGGLLSRAYVQSDAYLARHDVAHLITLGSPHLGAAKAYPYWEAAYLYEPLPEEYNQWVILLNYIARVIPWRVAGLHAMIPGAQDLLPTADYIDEGQTIAGYIYDASNGDALLAEGQMVHRNAYLTGLYEDVSTLFERTNTYAFYGTDESTPARFYTQPRPFWEWPAWDDGSPIWSRQAEFKSIAGDGTVMASSAKLPCPGGSDDCVRGFPGVDHGGMAGNNAVLTAIFDTLGISQRAEVEPGQIVQENTDALLVLSLYGESDFTITDPAGRSIGPGSAEIPGAEYASSPGDPYKLILIPAPLDGNFKVDVSGTGDGQYLLGLLDNFTPPASVITDTEALWDSAQSQIQAGITVTFELTYTEATSPTTSLIAVTPVIQSPVMSSSTVVGGWALPGQAIEIRQADSHMILGSGIVDADGHYLVTLDQPLQLGQMIYPWAGGVSGVPVRVGGFLLFIPVTEK